MNLTLSSTSRQILVGYTAPDTNPCTIEVSESASYSPVVNDVNTSLFSGASSDARSGGLGAGTTGRAVLIGTLQNPNGVTPLIAGNSNVYSRCLQVGTTHYIRVTCGATVGTGSIATKNRPLGLTYDEPMPITAAGTYGLLTQDTNDRSQQFIDPQFGTVLRKVSLLSDSSWVGSPDAMEFTENGAQWPWAQATVSDSGGTLGYLTQLLTNQAFTRLYWTNTSTGESRFLGYLVMTGGGGVAHFSTSRFTHAITSLFGNDPTKFYNIFLDDDSNARVVMGQLPASGNSYYDQSIPADGRTATVAWSDLTASQSLSAKLLAFDATYDQSKFNSFFYSNVQGDYLLFAIGRGSQNSYAWVGAYQISTNAVIAFAPMYLRAGSSGANNQRWCGFHTSQPLLNSGNFASWENHDLVDSSGAGAGPYTTTLVGAINTSVTSIVLASNTPTSPFPDTTLGPFLAQDEIRIDGEIMTLVTNTSGTTWTVLRAQGGTFVASHINGSEVRAGCRSHSPTDYTAASIMMWDFVNDPTGASVVAINDGINGHQSGANNKKIGSGWITCPDTATTPCASSLVASNSPAFNGITKNYGGNAGMMHAASVHQSNAAAAEQVWGMDFIHPYTDPDAVPASITNITGTLFKVTMPVTLDIKSLPIVGIAGVHKLLDISSPTTGNVIGGTSADYNKICIAYKVNECRTGSAVGDIYVNGQYVTTGSTCPTSVTPTDLTNSGLCIFNGPGSGTQNLLQVGINEAYANGKYLRPLTHGLAPYKEIGDFANAQASPDGRWAMFVSWQQDGKNEVWTVKVPPFPTYDGINRNTFIQKTVNLAGPAATVTAVTEFGYDPNFYCTSRSEVCVSAQSNNPFWFASESFTRISCASGICTNTIPVIPDRAVYYRHKFYDVGGNLINTSVTFLLTEDSAPVVTTGVSVVFSGQVVVSGPVIIGG